MKTRLISRVALMSLLLLAATASGTTFADEPGYDGYTVGTVLHRFDQSSLLKVQYHRHHWHRHHRHHRHYG
jgi:hypothetical protein